MNVKEIYRKNKYLWSTGIKVLLIQNLILFLVLGLLYGSYRAISLINNANTELSNNDLMLFIIYIAPAILLSLGTIKLASMDHTSKEIYGGTFAIYFFTSQLVYTIDIGLGASIIPFLITFLIVPTNVYVLMFDGKTKESFLQIKKNAKD